MPTWTTPKNTWQVNDIVTASDLNIIADDLRYLKNQTARGKDNIGPTTTSSTGSFVTLASVSVVTRGGDLLADFYASATHDSGGIGYFDVALDGTRVAFNGTDGSLEIKPGGSSPNSVALSLLLDSVSAGSHTVTLQWRT
ncbi:MAG TPA: hypothetical protein VHL11_24785, partial [Phototrophicaceae bacterium]|nr:hypothetical protein [Phototrophicaceae bacterium]